MSLADRVGNMRRSGEATPSRPLDDPWFAAMRRGDFEAAWHINDVRLACDAIAGIPRQVGPRHQQSVWDGTPLHGRRVLVRCYHGLGDTLQFIRYAEPLRRIAREVIVWAQPALLPLLRSARGIDRLLPLHDGRPDVRYDVDIEVMELAHALSLHPNAAAPPYLHAGRVEQSPSSVLRVGLVWAAGDWDTRRSVPVEALRLLTRVPGVRLLSLQCGAARRHASLIPAEDASTEDVLAAATRMSELDLTISVDSMPAHLAGALGLPVWTLLRRDCDWRWAEASTASVWYPSMRLFRQTREGAWDAVIAEVAEALHQRVAHASRVEGDGTKLSYVRCHATRGRSPERHSQRA